MRKSVSCKFVFCSIYYIFSNPTRILTDKIYFICSKTWSFTGFYVHVKLEKQNKILDVHCIMTNYGVFLQNDLVAVFHCPGTEKEAFELPLVSFRILAHSKVCTKYSPVACKWLQNLRRGRVVLNLAPFRVILIFSAQILSCFQLEQTMLIIEKL